MGKGSAPRPGESFLCTACGKESVAKCDKIMDGWHCIGEVLVCAFCKAQVMGDGPDSAASANGGSGDPGQAALDRLAGFLGTEPEETPRLDSTGDRRFCRDCVNYLRHPFVSRCLLHDQPVEPMNDCDAFEARPDCEDAATAGSVAQQP